MPLNIAVLFDGAGLARLGLELAGHYTVGVEIDPWKHYLSSFVGSGRCVLCDATQFDLSDFDAVWASPPCQLRSSARTQGPPISEYANDYLTWCLKIDKDILWVENVTVQGSKGNDWGKIYNAAQFLEVPLQNRNRIIGGRFKEPRIFHPYRKIFKDICPAIVATEYKGCASDTRRASRFYGRRLTVEECAYHQGIPLDVVNKWMKIPETWRGSPSQWRNNIYEAIGNAVPPYMSYGFGIVYQ